MTRDNLSRWNKFSAGSRRTLGRMATDPCQDDPRWLQILPSTELAPWERFWPVVPTYVHGGIEYGLIGPATKRAPQ